MTTIALSAMDGRYAVCRLAPDAPLSLKRPDGFFSISYTGEECSIVCREDALAVLGLSEARVQAGWRMLRVCGTLDFALTGILSRITAPLAQAGVSVFALSTFDTDYLLLPETDFERGICALRQAGFLLD